MSRSRGPGNADADWRWHRFAIAALGGLAELDATSPTTGVVVRGRTSSGHGRQVVAAGIVERARIRRRAVRSGHVVRANIVRPPGRHRAWFTLLEPEALRVAPIRPSLRRRIGKTPRILGMLYRAAAHGLPSVAIVVEAATTDADRCRSLVAIRSADGRRAVVVRGGPAGNPPMDIVKVGLETPIASPADPAVARAAGRDADVRVPRLFGAVRVAGEVGHSVEWVPGAPAAHILERDPASSPALIVALGSWLLRWAEMSETRRPLQRSYLDDRIFGPAEELRPLLAGGDAYLAHLEELFLPLVGSRIPFVEAHNDLTMHNVLIDDAGGVSVIDWDTWGGDALPWEDLHYAAADLAVAGRGVTRAAAVAETLHPAPLTPLHEMDHMVARRFRDGPATRALSVHACWLGHALREHGQSPHADRPFLAALRVIANTMPGGST